MTSARSRDGLKICLVGGSSVGKSCLVERLVFDRFDARMESTVIGRAYLRKSLIVKGKAVDLNIWDTAGEEKYQSLTPMYYRNASAMIFVYDITRDDSFYSLQTFWVPSVQAYNGQKIPMAIVGNKLDLELTARVVSSEKARGYAETLNAVFVETSAKTGHNVERLFTELVLKIRAAQRQSRRGSLAVELGVGNPTVTPAETRRSTCKCI